MARHFEKGIDAARDLVASTGRALPNPDPMSGEEIKSYLKGFGLSAHQVSMICTRWQEDVSKARRDSYDSGYEDGQAANY
jgi:hypothetical protein